jgi:anti-sigma regulatory factor (Ser/Thr protein kinase)
MSVDSADLPGDDEPYEFVRSVLPARPEYLRSMRMTVRNWLSGLGLPEDVQDDLELAADEALSNAIEHAYAPAQAAAGLVKLTLWTESQALYIEVSDQGRWLTPTNHVSYRGRGIELMRQLAQCVVIQAGTRGTTVLLRHQLPATPHVAPASSEPCQPTS